MGSGKLDTDGKPEIAVAKPQRPGRRPTAGARAARDQVDAIFSQWRTERPDIDTSPVQIYGLIARIQIQCTAFIEEALVPFGEHGPGTLGGDLRLGLLVLSDHGHENAVPGVRRQRRLMVPVGSRGSGEYSLGPRRP